MAPSSDTRLDREAIRAREEMATEGPWTSRIARSYGDGLETVRLSEIVSDSDVIVSLGGGVLSEDNAAFIAHARSDVPALLAERDALAQERADMRTSAQMYAATVDDQVRIIGDLRSEVERLEAEVARLRHLEDTARAWRAAHRQRETVHELMLYADACGAHAAAVDALPVRETTEEAPDA